MFQTALRGEADTSRSRLRRTSVFEGRSGVVHALGYFEPEDETEDFRVLKIVRDRLNEKIHRRERGRKVFRIATFGFVVETLPRIGTVFFSRFQHIQIGVSRRGSCANQPLTHS